MIDAPPIGPYSLLSTPYSLLVTPSPSFSVFTASFDALLTAALLYVAYLGWRRAWLGRTATAVALLAFLGLSAGLVLRGLEADRWPLTGRFEFALVFSWATLGVYLLLEWMGHPRSLGAFVMPIVVGLACHALLILPPAAQVARPLPPVLRSIWLQIHVLSAALGYGTGGAAAGLGALFLLRTHRPEAEGLPPADKIEEAMTRAASIGFPLLSLALLAGAIWGQTAWGRYWGWDPKEVWLLVTWLVYLTLQHGRSLRGWRGRRLAWLALLGFGCVLFAFLGVDWLVKVSQLQSLHVY
jgi:cytochrome c-type biogenesis protein CcsB